MSRLLIDLTLSLLQAFRTFIDVTIEHVEIYKQEQLRDIEALRRAFTPTTSSTSTTGTLGPDTPARCHWCNNPVFDRNTQHCEYHLLAKERDDRGVPRNHQRFSF